jgi:hypothetical protein
MANLTDTELVNYILFWEYLLSDVCMIDGIIDLYTRK